MTPRVSSDRDEPTPHPDLAAHVRDHVMLMAPSAGRGQQLRVLAQHSTPLGPAFSGVTRRGAWAQGLQVQVEGLT